MKPTIAKPFSDARSRSRRKIIGMYVLLIAGNLASWLWALVALHNYAALLGTAFLAYALGRRHAFDADHIAAIDNVTRKLMQEASDRRLQDCSSRWDTQQLWWGFPLRSR